MPLHLSNEEYHAETWHELIAKLRRPLTEEEDRALEREAIKILDLPPSVGSMAAFKSTGDSIFGHDKIERDTSLPVTTDRTNPPPVGESISARQPLRTWTDVTGKFKVKARLVSLKGGVVTLERESAKTFAVPLNKLSEADRAYVESNRAD